MMLQSDMRRDEMRDRKRKELSTRMVHGALVVGIPVDDVIANFWYFHALMIFSNFQAEVECSIFCFEVYLFTCQ